MTVADATPLIALARIGAFSLLQDVLKALVIPPAVFDEVVTKGGGRPGAPEVQAALSAGWITKAAPTRRLLGPYRGMHDGEIEVLSLAKERGLPALLDEKLATDRADREHIPWVGTIDVLRLAKALGYIPAVKLLVDSLRANHFHMDDELYERVLKAAGE